MTLFPLTEELYIVLDKGTVQAKRSILSRLGSNLVWNDKELNINNTKPIDALIKGISLAQQTNPKFEPKNCVVYKGSKEKTAEFSTVFSTMLPRQGSNLRPIDYTCPSITGRGGLYHLLSILYG